MSEAWQMFFCACCQRERPLTERVRVGPNKLSRCADCAARRRPKVKARYHHDDDEPTLIPTDVMDAYREMKGESA